MGKNDLTEKKIAVVGIGGVGGYLAAMLGRVCPHLTLAARGARGESIRENGLTLHSDYKGEIVVRPERVVTVDELGEQDYIFVCVKNCGEYPVFVLNNLAERVSKLSRAADKLSDLTALFTFRHGRIKISCSKGVNTRGTLYKRRKQISAHGAQKKYQKNGGDGQKHDLYDRHC